MLPVFSIVACCTPLASCSSSDAELYSKNYNVEDSSVTPQIWGKSLSLKFEYNSYIESGGVNNKTTISGTGWIWSVSGNSYYVATNMHVAGSSTYANNKFYQYDDNEYKKIIVASYTSCIGFYNGSNVVESSYVSVPNPTVVYTTINDSNFNSVINPSDSKSYSSSAGGYENLKYWGIADICILKYEINLDDYKTEHVDFYNWLSSYQNDQIIIYGSDKQDTSSLNLSKYLYYSAGFPKSSIPLEGYSIVEKPVSGFKLNNKVTKIYGEGWKINSSTSTPITFIDSTFANKTKAISDDTNQDTINDYSSDPTKTNFLNESYTGYFYGHSDEGSSGSMLVTNINGQLQIVGIYWGISTFEINGVTRELGSYDIFVTSKYNLAYNIQQAINSDISSSSN